VPAVEFFGIRLRYTDLVEDLTAIVILLIAGRALGGEPKPRVTTANSEVTANP
jgi:hypothetical protein